LQGVAFAGVGALWGLEALGLAMIVSAAASAAMWLRITLRHIGLPLRDLTAALQQSALVAAGAAVGPALVLWAYGPYPQTSPLPLILGGLSGLAGFVLAVVMMHHPLHGEISSLWARFTSGGKA
jgi:hypothetical protein